MGTEEEVYEAQIVSGRFADAERAVLGRAAAAKAWMDWCERGLVFELDVIKGVVTSGKDTVYRANQVLREVEHMKRKLDEYRAAKDVWRALDNTATGCADDLDRVWAEVAEWKGQEGSGNDDAAA